jgi:hypothetical protein
MTHRPEILCLTFVLLLLLPTAAVAQGESGNPENWCRNGAFPQDGPGLKLARVRGPRNRKVHFLNDTGDCPQTSNPKCVEKSYLMAGDEVIVSRKYGNWMCSWYEPQRGSETVGWLPLESLLVTEPDANPPPEKWIGLWKNGDNSLSIKQDGQTGLLHISGEAYWPGLRTNYPSVHTGEVQARAKPQGNTLALEEESCKVSLWLVGGLLVASDNLQCGGANVSFSGVYRKKTERRPPKRLSL